MKRGKLVVLSLVLAALLAAACAPAAAPTPPPTPKPAAPAVVSTPTTAPAPAPTQAPAPTPRPVVTGPTPTAAPAPQPSGDQPRYGGVLRLSSKEDPIDYDLHQRVSYNDLQPLAPVYSLLLRTNPKDETGVLPDLAERWEISPDGKTYTFFLHKGVQFHDGSPLTSADVKASFDRMRSPPKGVVSVRQAYYKNIDKIETPDDTTVRFTLKQPQGAFLTMVSVPFSVIFPKKLLDQKPDMKKDVMGSGAFVLKEHSRGVQIVVEKNPNYFIKGRPYLDGIIRYVIKD
ncbi:MAG: ABC transporter substrate-binding protein, partial [Chloroflexota bacterium]|nr:ABC transporter substrate-binding protein [Chloroflexota bacterium]